MVLAGSITRLSFIAPSLRDNARRKYPLVARDRRLIGSTSTIYLQSSCQFIGEQSMTETLREKKKHEIMLLSLVALQPMFMLGGLKLLQDY